MYIAGLVIPVPEEKMAAYRKWAERGAAIFKKYGCVEIVEAWKALDGRPAIGDGALAIGQIPISWDSKSVDAAIERAHDQFRWFGAGWSVNADLPTTAGFAAASSFVRPDDVASSIPCGPDLQAVVNAVKPFWETGFTDIALVQVGDELQARFLSEAAEPLLQQLREAAPS